MYLSCKKKLHSRLVKQIGCEPQPALFLAGETMWWAISKCRTSVYLAEEAFSLTLIKIDGPTWLFFLQIKHYMVLSPWLKLKFLSQAITNYRENIGQAFLEEKSVVRNWKVVSITCMHFSLLLVFFQQQECKNLAIYQCKNCSYS